MISIKQLPFFFKSQKDHTNGGFKPVLPFHLYYDEYLRMFRQKPYPELVEYLDTIYKAGSLAEGSISNESGEVYVQQVTEYILRHFKPTSDSKILEVGYGSGIILKKLKEKSVANLTGVEPGTHQTVSGLEGIRLINDFFPSPSITEKYNLIYSLLVLEHVEDPVGFINNFTSHLENNGKIILGVPNCETYLKDGDLSILIHEHFSYFTKESVVRIAEITGFFIEDISIIEGALIFTLSKNASFAVPEFEHIPSALFTDQIDSHISHVSNLISRYEQGDIAIYAPIRALNSLYLSGHNSCRLVDDSSELRGRYLPTMERPVESFQDLISKPPSCILIFSRTFGEKIRAKCNQETKLAHTTILTLADLNSETIRL